MKLTSIVAVGVITFMGLSFLGCSGTEANKENSTYEPITIDDSINLLFFDNYGHHSSHDFY